MESKEVGMGDLLVVSRKVRETFRDYDVDLLEIDLLHEFELKYEIDMGRIDMRVIIRKLKGKDPNLVAQFLECYEDRVREIAKKYPEAQVIFNRVKNKVEVHFNEVSDRTLRLVKEIGEQLVRQLLGGDGYGGKGD